MKRPSTFATLIGAAIALLLSLGSTPAAEERQLTRLAGIGDLKRWFNAQSGHPRLIFLLSPT